MGAWKAWMVALPVAMIVCLLSTTMRQIRECEDLIDPCSFSRRLLAANDAGIPADRMLLYNALRAIGDYTDIAFISGKRAKVLFEDSNRLPHLFIHNKMQMPLHTWKNIAQHVNISYEKQSHHPVAASFKGVHVHNELNVGDLLLTIMEEFRRAKGFRFPNPPAPVPISAEDVHRTMDFGQPPIVLTNTIDENWGFLSTVIVNRTTKWINMTNHLRLHFASYSTLRHVLDSDKIMLLLTSSHVDPAIGFHRKVLSVPLGIKARSNALIRARMLLALDFTKTKLLTINNSGWGPRTEINAMVSAAFNGTVVNSYERRLRKREAQFTLHNSTEIVTVTADHMLEIAQSKFVLCPSGLGYDTYRLWEVMLLGSIPIVESNPGMDRTLASLPVLIVKHFSYVTPELLARAYGCFEEHAGDFKFQHMREDYWLGIVPRVLQAGSADILMVDHPFTHKYCNFMS